MTDITRELFGEKHADREEKFDKGIEKIEKAHIDYFKERSSNYLGHKQDKLNHHFTKYYENGTYWFKWMDESDLKLEIRNEVEAFMAEIYGPPRKN